MQKPNITLVYRGGYNLMNDGTCRTIKNQYFKNSISNFESHGTFGATGVLEVWKIEKPNNKLSE